MKKVKKNKAGFTLVESLLAVVILILLSALAARGISVAVNAYTKVVDSANAQLLLSTTISEIRDELATGSEIVVDDDVITYVSSKTGDQSIIKKYVSGSEYEVGSITITEYAFYSTNSGAKTRLLVSKEASNKNLVCSYDNVEFINNEVIVINNLNVKRIGSLDLLANLDELSIKIG